MKKVFLEILQHSQKTPVPESFFNSSLRPAALLKKHSGKGVFCEFCEISTIVVPSRSLYKTLEKLFKTLLKYDFLKIPK